MSILCSPEVKSGVVCKNPFSAICQEAPFSVLSCFSEVLGLRNSSKLWLETKYLVCVFICYCFGFLYIQVCCWGFRHIVRPLIKVYPPRSSRGHPLPYRFHMHVKYMDRSICKSFSLTLFPTEFSFPSHGSSVPIIPLLNFPLSSFYTATLVLFLYI